MKAFFAVLLIAVVALAQQQECTGTSPFDGTTDVLTRAGYHLDFDIKKSDSDGVFIRLDLSEQFDDEDVLLPNRFLWIQLDPHSTASGATFKVAANGDAKPDATTPKLIDGVVVSSDTAFYNLSSATWATDYIWLQVTFSCTACVSSAEFSIETAVTVGEQNVYSTHALLDQTRTIGWATRTNPDASHTDWVVFSHNFTEEELDSGSLPIYFDLTFEDSVDKTAKIVVYFQKDTPPTLNSSDGKYPVNPIAGNWLQETPFTVNAGLYYFGFYTLESSSDSLDVDWTAKAGFGDFPCSMASGLVANVLLLALIPFTVLLNKF